MSPEISQIPTGPNRVFIIPELLEAILLSADVRTILVSQRVCKYWCALIYESPRLLRALFFEPDTNATFSYNPLLQEVFPFCFPQYEGDFRVYAKSEDPVPDNSEFRDRGEFDVGDIIRKATAFQREDASWRHMLVQQPPSRELCHLVTMEPDHQIFVCHSCLPPMRKLAGRFLPRYIRMPDLLPLALAPTYISFGELPEDSPFSVKVRVLWHSKPPRITNSGTADLIERMVEAHGVVVHNIGDLEPCHPIKEVSRLRQIFQDM